MDAKDILKELVKCNTIQDKENKKILDYIENVCKQLGFDTQKRDKYLIVKNKETQSLGFVGHTDTVEFTDGWKYEKFDVTEENGKLYGLGVCDMKSGIAAIISAISQVDFNRLKNGMKLIFTYDEEIGFGGIKDVVVYEKNYPNTFIIGEPTYNEMLVGSKGLMEYKISLQGVKAHSSTPEKGKSAIYKAIDFINELRDFYEKVLKQEKNDSFDIPYTTMNVGIISGGSAKNSVPNYCEFFVDFRTISSNTEMIIEEKIDELSKRYNAQIETLERVSSFYNEMEFSNKTANFMTEASFLGGNRIILGAGPVTAHEIDEYIEEESLYKLVEQYKELIVKFCK